MTGFADHFSGVAYGYATFRPRYPDALFAALAQCAPATDVVWDCGCATGRASVALASHFERVHATEASAQQIAQAEPHELVAYHVAPAESSGLPTASVSLETVAKALHWFDVDAFHAEERRVLNPDRSIIDGGRVDGRAAGCPCGDVVGRHAVSCGQWRGSYGDVRARAPLGVRPCGATGDAMAVGVACGAG